MRRRRKKKPPALDEFELEERAALIADGCGVAQTESTEMAKKQMLGNWAWKQGDMFG
jgi:hypothetical protein